jgi:pimeloyl-ACP methyl ester carboxylesterase
MDFPGLGFSDRPANFEYTWTALSGWLEKALAAADIDKFHLVLHDVGGPVGFDLVRRIPDRIESLTVLNTIIDVGTFKKPVVMRPYSVPLLGRLWVLQMNSPLIVGMFRMKGVLPGPSNEELRAYGKLLTRVDGGRGFQKIMSRFETTADFEKRIKVGLQNRKFPAQIIWGKYDDELTVDKMGMAIKRALNLQTEIYQVEGKHFLQENCAPEIAERVSAIVKAGEDL